MLFVLFLLGCVSDHYLSHGVVETEKEYVYVQDIYIEGEEEPPDPDPIWVDSFVQPQISNGVDIIWVIDGSGSMNDEYPKVLQGISDMLSNLPMISWRLMIISMTAYEASVIQGLPLIPGDSVQDALDMFAQNVNGNHEQGFHALKEFLMYNSDAQQWLREDAALLAVFVSDEDDGSGNLIPTASSMASWLSSYREHVYVASIVNLPVDESECSLYAHNTGTRYIDLANMFNGQVIDICTEDWSQGVADASTQIQLREYLDLSHVPLDPQHIYVFVDGLEYHDWSYDASLNRVVFSVTPPENSLVEIAYYY